MHFFKKSSTFNLEGYNRLHSAVVNPKKTSSLQKYFEKEKSEQVNNFLALWKATTPKGKYTPFVLAAIEGKFDYLIFMIEAFLKDLPIKDLIDVVKIRDDSSKTILHYDALGNQFKIINFIANKLIEEEKLEEEEKFKFLVEILNEEITIDDISKITILHLAFAFRQFSLIKQFVGQFSDKQKLIQAINVKNSKQQTPLEYLLFNKSNEKISNEDGSKNSNEDGAEISLLILKGARINFSINKIDNLVDLGKKDKELAVEIIFWQIQDIVVCLNDHIIKNKPDFLNLYNEALINICRRSFTVFDNNMNSLHIMAMQPETEKLFESFDILTRAKNFRELHSSQNNSGKIPLVVAIETGRSIKLIRQLYELLCKYAPVEQMKTLAHWVAEYAKDETVDGIIKIFEEQKNNLTKEDSLGWTPLQQAAYSSRSSKVIRKILQEINSKEENQEQIIKQEFARLDRDGYSLPYLAVISPNANGDFFVSLIAVEIIEDNKSKIHIREDLLKNKFSGQPLLHIAATLAKTHVLQKTISVLDKAKRADLLNQYNDDNQTSLDVLLNEYVERNDKIQKGKIIQVLFLMVEKKVKVNVEKFMDFMSKNKEHENFKDLEEIIRKIVVNQRDEILQQREIFRKIPLIYLTEEGISPLCQYARDGKLIEAKKLLRDVSSDNFVSLVDNVEKTMFHWAAHKRQYQFLAEIIGFLLGMKISLHAITGILNKNVKSEENYRVVDYLLYFDPESEHKPAHIYAIKSLIICYGATINLEFKYLERIYNRHGEEIIKVLLLTHENIYEVREKTAKIDEIILAAMEQLEIVKVNQKKSEDNTENKDVVGVETGETDIIKLQKLLQLLNDAKAGAQWDILFSLLSEFGEKFIVPRNFLARYTQFYLEKKGKDKLSFRFAVEKNQFKLLKEFLQLLTSNSEIKKNINQLALLFNQQEDLDNDVKKDLKNVNKKLTALDCMLLSTAKELPKDYFDLVVEMLAYGARTTLLDDAKNIDSILQNVGLDLCKLILLVHDNWEPEKFLTLENNGEAEKLKDSVQKGDYSNQYLDIFLNKFVQVYIENDADDQSFFAIAAKKQQYQIIARLLEKLAKSSREDPAYFLNKIDKYSQYNGCTALDGVLLSHKLTDKFFVEVTISMLQKGAIIAKVPPFSIFPLLLEANKEKTSYKTILIFYNQLLKQKMASQDILKIFNQVTQITDKTGVSKPYTALRFLLDYRPNPEEKEDYKKFLINLMSLGAKIPKVDFFELYAFANNDQQILDMLLLTQKELYADPGKRNAFIPEVDLEISKMEQYLKILKETKELEIKWDSLFAMYQTGGKESVRSFIKENGISADNILMLIRHVQNAHKFLLNSDSNETASFNQISSKLKKDIQEFYDLLKEFKAEMTVENTSTKYDISNVAVEMKTITKSNG